jgi:hypothetical protein
MFHHFLLFLSLLTLLFLLLFLSLFLSPLAKKNHVIPSCKKKTLQQKNEFCNGCMKKKGFVMDV